jgi:hypothetical protein
MLGNVEKLPSEEEIANFLKEQVAIKKIVSADDTMLLHTKAKEFLNNNDVLSAWKVLLVKL